MQPLLRAAPFTNSILLADRRGQAWHRDCWNFIPGAGMPWMEGMRADWSASHGCYSSPARVEGVSEGAGNESPQATASTQVTDNGFVSLPRTPDEMNVIRRCRGNGLATQSRFVGLLV